MKLLEFCFQDTIEPKIAIPEILLNTQDFFPVRLPTQSITYFVRDVLNSINIKWSTSTTKFPSVDEILDLTNTNLAVFCVHLFKTCAIDVCAFTHSLMELSPS
jgi:hypothetical protein